MQQFSKWNKGYRYLLMIIDVFSKYGWIVPLKDKKGESVAEAFKTIFKEGRKPQYLWVDKGKEYYNKHVKDLLEKNKITLYSTENEEKSSVVERWNRTIKSKMWKQFTVQGNTIYFDMLPKILKKYNNTKHSSIKMTPTEASNKNNEGIVYFNLYGDIELPKRGILTVLVCIFLFFVFFYFFYFYLLPLVIYSFVINSKLFHLFHHCK